MSSHLGRRLAQLVMALFLLLALWILHRQLHGYHYNDIRQSLAILSSGQLFAAFALTLLSYLLLTGYDTLALRYIRHELPYRRRGLASFLGYASSHNLGLSLIGGAAPRYRLYSAWGLSTLEIATIVGFVSLTFWLGGFTVGGAILLSTPATLATSLHLSPAWARALGMILLLLVAGFLLAAALRKEPFTLAGWEVSLPRPAIAVGQVALSTLDWFVVAGALYVLLPAVQSLSYWHVVGIFVLATLGGVASQIPGGLGVFETIVLVALTPYASGPAILSSLIAFRVIYYLLPLAAATTLLAAHEMAEHREKLSPLVSLFGSWVPEAAPRLFAVTTFGAGATLLLSGATPAVHSRLAWLRDVLPLPVLEISHFLGSLAGLGLVLLASGLQQRLDAAYHLTVLLLAAGAGLSILKGLDYGEAVILAAMLAILIPCRRHFYRRASIISQRFTLGWSLAVILVVVGFLWVGVFAHKHVEYANELWWQFSLYGDAPRFLRASVGVVVIGLFFTAAHLLRPAQVKPALPGRETMEKVRGLVLLSRRAAANLALLGDKSFLFTGNSSAFIMYGVAGRSWVAMGDPIGSEDDKPELVWRFRELCDYYAAWPVFYQVNAASLPIYIDVGLSPLKIGEEGRVSLSSFSLVGGDHKRQRRAIKDVERAGGIFEMISPGAVPNLLPELRVVSDTWLTEKRTREKGFSVGRFDARYLSHFPAAIVRQGDSIVAFANVWCSADHHELSPDLMRYRPDAPREVMEYLFIKLMLWGREEGFSWFNLGMAPLAGLESRALAPLWNRLGAYAFRFGEHFYNFQGIRQYKEKFAPQWEPKYLVCPGGIILPRVLANVASLISGGLKGVVAK